jgi:hypothetical protein
MSSTLDYAIMRTDHQAVEQFVERLSSFGLDDWRSVAASATRDPDAGSGANDVLEKLIAEHGLGVEAWDVRDDVETAVHFSVGSMGFELSRRDCASLRLARQAANRAAVGLLVRPLLRNEHFEALYCPFATLVPLAAGSVQRRAERALSPVRLVPLPVNRWRRGNG